MRARFLSSVAVVPVLLLGIACSKGSDGPTTSNVTNTSITLGPDLAAGNNYHPAATGQLQANWTGFCPVASPSDVTIIAGNDYQIVNRSSQTVQIVVLPNNTVLETIAAGATGARTTQYGAVSQSSVTYRYSVVGCTDTANGQSLFTMTVTSK